MACTIVIHFSVFPKQRSVQDVFSINTATNSGLEQSNCIKMVSINDLDTSSSSAVVYSASCVPILSLSATEIHVDSSFSDSTVDMYDQASSIAFDQPLIQRLREASAILTTAVVMRRWMALRGVERRSGTVLTARKGEWRNGIHCGSVRLIRNSYIIDGKVRGMRRLCGSRRGHRIVVAIVLSILPGPW